MSLLTNVNTIHLYNRWISTWYEGSPLYSNLIYSDLYVYEFINGIYYQLKMPSSILDIKELNFNQIIIRLNLYIFKKRKQKRSSLFFNNKTEFFIFHKKINYLLHKVLFIDRQYKKIKKYSIFLFNLKKIKRKIKKKNISYLLHIKQNVNYIRKLKDRHKYKKYLKPKIYKNFKKKKKLFLINDNKFHNRLKFQFIYYFFLNIFGINYFKSINNKLYVFYLNNYYKTNNFKNKYSQLIKYNNKNLLKYYYYVIKKIKINKKRIIYRKKFRFCTKYKKKKWKIKLEIIKKKNKIYRKLLKNKKIFFNGKYRLNFVNHKRKKRFRFFLRNNKMRSNLKYLNNLYMKIYKKSFKKMGIFKKKRNISKNKIIKFLYNFNKQKYKFDNFRKKKYLKKKLFLTKKKLILKRYRNRNRRKMFYKKKKKKKK